MTVVQDAITAIRQALRLTDDVKCVGENLKEIAQELRDHERRIARLEVKWETAIELSSIRDRHPRQIENEEKD